MLHYVKNMQQVPDSSSPSVSLVSVFLTFFPFISHIRRLLENCTNFARPHCSTTALDTESRARKMTDAPALIAKSFFFFFFESHCQ